MIKNFKNYIQEDLLQEKYLRMTRIQVALGSKGVKEIPFIIDEYSLTENINYKKILNYNLKTYFSDPKLMNNLKATALRFFVLIDSSKNKIYCYCWPSDVIHQYFIKAVTGSDKNPVTGYNFINLYHDLFNKKEVTNSINLFPGTFENGHFNSSSPLVKELNKKLNEKGTSLEKILGINNISEIKSAL